MTWKQKDTCMYHEGPKCKHIEKLACFDWDGTLSLSPRGEQSASYSGGTYILAYKDTIEKLKDFHKKGYIIIIFSNRKGQPWERPTIKSYLISFMERCGFNMWIFLAIGGKKTDLYRKPNTGMMSLFISLSGVTNYGNDSFYCGDASGETSTNEWFKWRDSDRKFANEVKLVFYEPTDIFVQWVVPAVINPNIKLIITCGQLYSGWHVNIKHLGTAIDLKDGRSLIITSPGSTIATPINGTTPIYYYLGSNPTKQCRLNIMSHFNIQECDVDIHMYFRGSSVKKLESKDYITKFQLPKKFYRCS